jgi:hypothetical protein
VDKIYCVACGAELDEDCALPPEQRPPCPVCGSFVRARSVVLSDTARASDSLTVAAIRPVGIDSGESLGTPTVVVQAQPATVTVTAHDASVEARTHTSERVVEETGVVVRVVRHYPPTADGRRVTTVEDEHGTIRDLGAGDTTEDTLLDMIIGGALREDQGE